MALDEILNCLIMAVVFVIFWPVFAWCVVVGVYALVACAYVMLARIRKWMHNITD